MVGILLRARKHKLLDFEGEMLFQRRDDDVPIFLLKPIQEIRQELESKIEEIKRAGSPAPQATSLVLDKSAHKQKLGSRSSTPSASPAPSKPATPAQSKASTPMQSKASSPEPTDIGKLPVAPVTTAEPTAQPAIVNTTQTIPPEVTITAASAGEVTEATETSEPIARLEGGQEAKTPANKDDLPPRIDINAAETEISVNQYTAELEPVIAEHAGMPAATSAEGANNPNAELAPIVIDTGVHTRTLPTLQEDATAAVPVQAPTTAEVSAAGTATEPAARNNEANPEE